MKTVCLFRVLNGDVIALFPYEPGNMSLRTCSSYIHVGQHGAADVSLIAECRPATPDEYRELAAELTGLGYDLDVRETLDSPFEARKARLHALNRSTAS